MVCIYEYSGIKIPVEKIEEDNGKTLCKILADVKGFEKGEERKLNNEQLKEIEDSNDASLITLFS